MYRHLSSVSAFHNFKVSKEKPECCFIFYVCLSRCCSASDPMKSSLSSCTHPLQPSPTNNDNFCPSPPSLSLYSDTSGPLDTDNTFIAEHLLRLSTSVGEQDTGSFLRRYQAGFTIAPQDPLVTACGYDMANKWKTFQSSGPFDSLYPYPCNSTDFDCPTLVDGSLCPTNRSGMNLLRKNGVCFSVEPSSAYRVQARFYVCIFCSALCMRYT